jgi:hypothetical protein
MFGYPSIDRPTLLNFLDRTPNALAVCWNQTTDMNIRVGSSILYPNSIQTYSQIFVLCGIRIRNRRVFSPCTKSVVINRYWDLIFIRDLFHHTYPHTVSPVQETSDVQYSQDQQWYTTNWQWTVKLIESSGKAKTVRKLTSYLIKKKLKEDY